MGFLDSKNIEGRCTVGILGLLPYPSYVELPFTMSSPLLPFIQPAVTATLKDSDGNDVTMSTGYTGKPGSLNPSTLLQDSVRIELTDTHKHSSPMKDIHMNLLCALQASHDANIVIYD